MTPRLLIVDDDAATRLLLVEHFTRRGSACQAASDGTAALALLAEGVPDVLITELEMPGMDGLTLLHQVRKRGLLPRCVVITGYIPIHNLASCLREGAVALVPKPLADLDPLDRAVDQAVDQMRLWTEQMRAILHLRPPPACSGSADTLEQRGGHAP